MLGCPSAEFRGNNHAIAVGTLALAENVLGNPVTTQVPVERCGVEQGNTAIERCTNGIQGAGFRNVSISLGSKCPRSKSDLARIQSCSSQFAVFQDVLQHA